MTSEKFPDFFTPPVTVTKQLILFLLSAFWGPTADVIYGSPQSSAKAEQFLQEHLARRESATLKGESGWEDIKRQQMDLS